jgi:hypothetical protein
MTNWGMVIGDIVAFVLIARCLVVLELFLTVSVPKPVVLHVHDFSFFMTLLFTMSSAIVLSV